jgi:hypothetical protein
VVIAEVVLVAVVVAVLVVVLVPLGVDVVVVVVVRKQRLSGTSLKVSGKKAWVG